MNSARSRLTDACPAAALGESCALFALEPYHLAQAAVMVRSAWIVWTGRLGATTESGQVSAGEEEFGDGAIQA